MMAGDEILLLHDNIVMISLGKKGLLFSGLTVWVGGTGNLVSQVPKECKFSIYSIP